MCGIVGIIGFEPLRSDERESVAVAQDALKHRGPDGGGEFADEHVAMAMRRLSIIDLKGGWQPLYNEDRSLALIANGEIYNHVELREELKAKGHRFSTSSDCETILHLYEDLGDDAVLRLRGMFAFALYDTKKHRVLLARDRMGEKPLYLSERNGRICFSSELKSLMKLRVAPDVRSPAVALPFELDPASIHLYFHYAYVPEPRTMVRGVRKLDAAHLLSIDLKTRKSTERCYWRMEDAPPLDADPATVIREKFEEIGELIIRSDVPVGVALSGGLDSSAIAALAAKKYGDGMCAFSVGYEGRPPCDERDAAHDLAKRLKMPFHDVELRASEIVATFPRLALAMDEPVADISGFGYLAVMQLAREKNVPVLLQGQGGDEMFWGYSWLRDALEETRRKQTAMQKGWTALPSYFPRAKPDAQGKIPRTGFKRWARNWGGLKPALKHYRKHRNAPADQMVFYDIAPGFGDAETLLPHLYRPEFLERVNADEASNPCALFSRPHPWPDLGVEMTRLISQTYLRRNGFAQGDRLSMACSVEMRLPLVDYQFVETVIGLRKRHHDYALPPKTWFKEALKGLLPDDVMRRPKRGFEPPVQLWKAKLFEKYGERLRDGYLVREKMFDAAAAESFENRPWPMCFEALLLEMWATEFQTYLKS